jgi:3-methyladenine DNA glycosylase Tag
MKSLEQSISPGQQKINEYAERIYKGEDPAKIMQGLGANFRDGIEKRLLELEKQNSQTQEKVEISNEQKTETVPNSRPEQSEPENVTEKVPDQEQIIREQQKQERLVQEQKQIEELRKQLGVVESKKEDLDIDSLINNAQVISFIDKENAPFKNFHENSTGSWNFVPDETIRNYLDTKFFFDTRSIPSDNMKEVSFIQKDFQIPLDLVVNAAGFTSWKGRGEAIENKKSFYSKYLKGDQNNTMSSLNGIKHYAGLSSEIPPVDTMRLFIQPDGKIFLDNSGGDSHRIAAAILRGQSTINTRSLQVYSLDKNFL